MTKPRRALTSLASEINPLDDLELVVDGMKSQTAESRCLEWKACGLFGRDVTVRTKYRTVKAAISFSNTEGGFVLFGVDPKGRWIGLPDEELAELDPAKVTELINGVVFPELPVINFAQFAHDGLKFAVLHIPPSPLIPHVTTREITETDALGKRKIVLARHTVYSRHGAKSDVSTPMQHQKIVEKRTLHVRDELVRRVREIRVPVVAHGRTPPGAPGTVLTVARLSNDPSAPLVRLTRSSSHATGVLLHEELSEGIFEEINNVLDANKLLAGAENQFIFGEEIYYRVYAERHHVEPTRVSLLLQASCREIYAPFLYWVMTLPPEVVAQEIVRSVENPKHPFILGVFRLFFLLGRDATTWLGKTLDRRYKHQAQPPEFYWTFKRMAARSVADRCLLAMRTTATATLNIPGIGETTVSNLLAKPEESASHLSKICLRIFRGEGSDRTIARQLDIAAYGRQIEAQSAAIWNEVKRVAVTE